MNCKACRGEQLSAYLDGMMNGEQLRGTTAHLADCEACREQYEGLRRMRDMLRSVDTPARPPQAEFWANAYRTARLASSPKAKPAVFSRAMAARISAVCSFVIVVGAALFTVSQPGGRLSIAPPPTPDAAVVDMGDLVQAHANYAASQPLTDRARVTMVTSDIASERSAGGAGDGASAPDESEIAVNAATGMD